MSAYVQNVLLQVTTTYISDRFDYGDQRDLVEPPNLPSTSSDASSGLTSTGASSGLTSTETSAGAAIEAPTALNADDFLIMKPSSECECIARVDS
jgi:hypothetical protein